LAVGNVVSSKVVARIDRIISVTPTHGSKNGSLGPIIQSPGPPAAAGAAGSETDGLSRLQVDDQHELFALFYGQIGRSAPLKFRPTKYALRWCIARISTP
jgi:hypothetical protein